MKTPGLRRAVLHRTNVIAIDKPAGLAVQGGASERHLDAMLDAALRGPEHPPGSRLDRVPAGAFWRAALAAGHWPAFRDRGAKLYWAVTVGVPKRYRAVDLRL
jgi:23S rRNA-/tRNA-specific pseudouridylate synthase